MKKQALIVAAVLACGSAAFAADDHSTARTDNNDTHAGQKMSDGMHRLGEKIRNGMHRMGEKLHAHNDRADRHNDTRAMGASGRSDHDHDRQSRMDEAYSNWQSKHDKTAQKDERR